MLNIFILKSLSSRKEIVLIFFLFLFFKGHLQSNQTLTFNFTGFPETWVVPPCVNSIQFEIAGAKGGGSAGGNGALITGYLSVTPGQTLQLNVGGMGSCPGAGYNGGGAGVSASSTSNNSSSFLR